MVNASWYSLCRAIRSAPRNHDFSVIAVDDSGENFETDAEKSAWLISWRSSCQTSRLKRLARVKGTGDILKNLQIGFKWAMTHPKYVFDWVVNLESDMLLVKNFFFQMARDYRLALKECGNPLISGYASNTGEYVCEIFCLCLSFFILCWNLKVTLAITKMWPHGAAI